MLDRLFMPPAPPRREPGVFELHGDRLEDPYLWLEDFDAPEVQAWIAAERQSARTLLDGLAERANFRAILERLRIDRGVVDAPVWRGETLFYRHRDPAHPYPILMARRGLAGEPFPVLDPATLFDVPGRIDFFQPSPAGTYVAVGASRAGNEQSVLFVIETATGRRLPEAIAGCDYGTVVWVDETHFYHTRFPGPGLFCVANQGVRLHEVGTSGEADPIVFEHPDGKDMMSVLVASPDGRFVAIVGGPSGFDTDIFWLDRAGDGRVQTLVRGGGIEHHVEGFRGTTAYVLSTRDASRGRLFAVDLTDPAPERWRELLAEGEDVLLNVVVTPAGLVVESLHHGTSRLRLLDFDGAPRAELPVPGPGTVGIYRRVANNSRVLEGRPDGADLFYRFSSFTYPLTVFHVDLASLSVTRFDPTPPPFDPAAYVARQVRVPSRDGTQVPVTLVHRQDVVPDGSAPTLLCGYGGWGLAWTPSYWPRYMAWLEAGGVLASASVRGGNEYGQAWYDGGRALNKQNSFDDFIAAAEWLVQDGLARPERLAIEGASAGGLLVGVAMTQRPDLFAAAAPIVGTFDVLRNHLDPRSARAVEELGTAAEPAAYRAIARYSPYHHVRPGTRYPATLVYTAADDQRLPPWQSAKFAAALRHAQAGTAPIVLYVAERGGHNMGGPDMDADVLGFLWHHTC